MGYAIGTACLGSVAEAADAACAAVDGAASGGVTACASVASSAAASGAGTAVLNIERTSESGVVSYTQARAFPPCESYDLTYFAPVWPVYILALVLVLCARWLFSYFRTRESL